MFSDIDVVAGRSTELAYVIGAGPHTLTNFLSKTQKLAKKSVTARASRGDLPAAC